MEDQQIVQTSPSTVGMGKRKQKQPSIPVRQCANIKSKKHPDARCPLAANQGDFCARHSKNPTRFQEEKVVKVPGNKKNHYAAKKIQHAWRLWAPLLRFKRQGPAVNAPQLAENQTEVFSMEPVSAIPLLYRWSYADSQRHCWLFDLRSLGMMRAKESKPTLENPYTREDISGTALKSFQQRCTQLRAQKYVLMHSAEVELTQEQLWHQQLLDTTIKYDALGYHMAINWFEALNTQQMYLFYFELWELWTYRLQLPAVLKHAVVPGWTNPETPLFKWIPQELRNRRDRIWWQKLILEMLNRFVSAPLKDHKSLGALYAMTAFAIVSPLVRDSYPYLVEMQDDMY
jgi:hypothetical protein